MGKAREIFSLDRLVGLLLTVTFLAISFAAEFCDKTAARLQRLPDAVRNCSLV